jgi:hypothetical protein
MRRLFPVAVLLAAVACRSPAQPPAKDEASMEPRPVTTSECRVTLPSGEHAPGDPAGLGKLGYGNGQLWVGLWPHGRVQAAPDQVNRRGAILMKFPWDRAVRGRLHVSGMRLDAPAPPLRASLSDYGLTGFQPSTLIFPTEGCWQVTGTVKGRASLTFVTEVTARAV